MSVYGFRQLVRSANLIGEHLSVSETDDIFMKVVKDRGGRMGVSDMLIGLAVIARRLYPDSETPSTAFYELVRNASFYSISPLSTIIILTISTISAAKQARSVDSTRR